MEMDVSENLHKKRVVIHIPDDVTYVRHFHPKVIYIKEKFHGTGYTTTTTSHEITSPGFGAGFGAGAGGGHSVGKNPLKFLLSSEIHPAEIKPAGWSNSGLLNQGSYSVSNNDWPPTGIKGAVSNEVNHGLADNGIQFPNTHINNNELISLNSLGGGIASSANLNQGHYESPGPGVAGGSFNDGKEELGNDLHHSGSSSGVINGLSNPGPQLFSNNVGNSGTKVPLSVSFNGGSNVQAGFEHIRGNLIGNQGGGYGTEVNAVSLTGQNSGNPQAGIQNGAITGNDNGWTEAGLTNPPSFGNNIAWPGQGVVDGLQSAVGNDWVPLTLPTDNSLWFPMNIESWPQNHASQPQAQSNFNQDILNPNLGQTTQEYVGGNADTGESGNGVQEGLSYTSPNSQILISENVAGFSGLNNGNQYDNSNGINSGVEMPLAWKNPSHSSGLVNGGNNGNIQNVLHHPEIANGFEMIPIHIPTYETGGNIGNAADANDAIASNNGVIGANNGAFAVNYVNGASSGGQTSSYGVNVDSYQPDGNTLGSINPPQGALNYNGYSNKPNIGAYMTIALNNGNHGDPNSYQAGYASNANNVACKRFKKQNVKVDSYHPCYEPNNEANQDHVTSLSVPHSSGHHGHSNEGNIGSYPFITNINPSIAAYSMPGNNILGSPGSHNSHPATANHNGAGNGIYQLIPNANGANINSHGNGGNDNMPPYFGNYLNNFVSNNMHNEPIYMPVETANINQLPQGYTGSSTNIKYPNNQPSNNFINNNKNYGGVVNNNKANYGSTSGSNGVTNNAVDAKYTIAKVKPNSLANGGPYEIPSAANYEPTNNHLGSTLNAPASYGGISSKPSSTAPTSNVYYDYGVNTYNAVGTANYGVNNNHAVSSAQPINGHNYGGNSNLYSTGNIVNIDGHYKVLRATNYGVGGNNFEIPSNNINPLGNGGNLQTFSTVPNFSMNGYDAHSSPSSSNFGTLVSYVGAKANNINYSNKGPPTNFYGRSEINRIPNRIPGGKYDSQSNTYRAAANGSYTDVTSEHGHFVSYPAHDNGESSYRGNGNRLTHAASYGASTSRPSYFEHPEHRGLTSTPQTASGSSTKYNAHGGIVKTPVNSGRYTSPAHELNTLNEIIRNSHIYKGIANVNGANEAPINYVQTAAHFGINNNPVNRGVHSVPEKGHLVTNAEYSQPNSAIQGNVVYSSPVTVNHGKDNIYSLANKVNHGLTTQYDHSIPSSVNQVKNFAYSGSRGNVAYSVPRATSQGNKIVYSVPNSGSQGNKNVYSVTNSGSQENKNVYSIPNSGSHRNVVYSVPNSANHENVAYNVPSNAIHGHKIDYSVPKSVSPVNVVYRVPNSEVKGKNNFQGVPKTESHRNNVVYKVPNSATHGNNVAYSVPNSANHGNNAGYSVPNSGSHINNVAYSVPNSAAHGNVAYSVPNSAAHGNVAYSVPNSAAHGNVAYSVPNSAAHGNFAYSVPNSANHGNVAHSVTNSAAHGNVAYSVPNSAAYVNVAYNVPNSATHGNAAYSIPNSANHGNVAHSVPNSAAHGNVAYSVPNSAAHGNVAYSVPKSVAHGNVAHRVPNSAAHGNVAYSVPNSANHENVVYSVPNSAAHGNVAHSVPNSVDHGIVAFSIPNSEAHVNVAYNAPNSASQGNVAYSIPSNAIHGKNVAYSISNSGSHGNAAYSVPNSAAHGNAAYSIPNSATHGNNIAYSSPNGGIHGNYAYRGPSTGGHTSSVPHRNPPSSQHQSALQTLTSTDNRGNNAAYDSFSSSSGNKNPNVAHTVPNSAVHHRFHFTSKNPGLGTHGISGNRENSAYNEPSRENQNVHNAYIGTNFRNNANSLVSSGSNKNNAYRVPNLSSGRNNSGLPSLTNSGSNINNAFIKPTVGNLGNNVFSTSNSVNHGNNAYSLTNSGSNINNAFINPTVGNLGNNVFSTSNSVNHGNNAYSVSNSVKHLHADFNAGNSESNSNNGHVVPGRDEHGLQTSHEVSGNRNHSRRAKGKRLKSGHHKVRQPVKDSYERDIIANIHEEALKFVENYKIPANGNFGTSESSDRHWNKSKRHNLRTVDGVNDNRKSRYRDNAILNSDHRVNNYTPSGPDKVNLRDSSGVPFNVNRPGNGRNYANTSLRNLSNSENHVTNVAATRNYVINSYHNSRFRGI